MINQRYIFPKIADTDCKRMVIAVKFVKGIGLFFIYPLVLFGLGFYAGVCTTHFFYPGEQKKGFYYEPGNTIVPSAEESEEPEEFFPVGDDCIDYETASEEFKDLRETSNISETLCVETEYVLEECDIDGDTTVETIWKLPDKYVGMNREHFIEAMELYEAFPPLSEMERGFVSLEVLSFSRKRVVVQMNYRYVQPSNGFFLAVYNNKIIVYLEDKETIFIETDIVLEQLPENIQQDIINMMWLDSEEDLYNFLETYSS